MRRKILAMMLSVALTVSALSPCTYAAEVSAVSPSAEDGQEIMAEEAGEEQAAEEVPDETGSEAEEAEVEASANEEEETEAPEEPVAEADQESDEDFPDEEKTPEMNQETVQEELSEDEVAADSETVPEQDAQAMETDEKQSEEMSEEPEENTSEPEAELPEDVQTDLEEEILEESVTAETTEDNLTIYSEKDNDITVSPGESTDLEVSAGVEAGNIFYRWYSNGDEVKGETEATLRLTDISQSITYRCEVTDDYENIEYVYFYITVDGGLTVSSGKYNYITVEPRDSMDLTVIAGVKAGNISYTWYKDNWEEQEEETEATLHLSEVSEDSEYYCYVEDDYGNSEKIYFYITVNSGFVVYSEYNNYMTVKPLESAKLEVSASVEAGTLSYQWYGDGLLEGETEEVLYLSNIDRTDSYSCDISDDYGHSTSVYFYITVDGGLAINNDPRNYITVKPLEDTDLTVLAEVASGNITYQWYDDWSGKMSGETGATLHLTECTKSNTYYCYVEDGYGNREKVYFDVTVDSGLTVYETQYKKVLVKPGEDTELMVTAGVDFGAITYGWYHEYGDKVGTDEPTLYLKNITKNAVYYCYLDDNYGNNERIRFEIVVDSGFEIEYDAMNTNLTVASGESVDLTVVADTETGEVSYSWYKGKYSAHLEETGATLHLADITENGTYSCLVSDQYNSVGIEFTVNVEGTFYVDWNAMQTDVVVPYGDSVDLTVIADSSEESLTYR